MGYDIRIDLVGPKSPDQIATVIESVIPNVKIGKGPFNTPETNPHWDEMPEFLREHLSEQKAFWQAECEMENRLFELRWDDAPSTAITGEGWGKGSWEREFQLICERLDGQLK